MASQFIGFPFHGQWSIFSSSANLSQKSTNNLSWDRSLCGTCWHAAGKRSWLKWHPPWVKWQCTRMTSSPLKTTVVSLRPRQRPQRIPKISCHSCHSLMLNVHLCFLMPADACSYMAVWLYRYICRQPGAWPFRILHVTKLRSAHDSLGLTKAWLRGLWIKQKVCKTAPWYSRISVACQAFKLPSNFWYKAPPVFDGMARLGINSSSLQSSCP